MFKIWARALVIFPAFLGFAGPLFCQSAILDRVLVEVSRQSYTQRQMENFILVQSAALYSLKDSPNYVGAGNWDEAIHYFRDTVIVDQEAQRLSGIAPSHTQIQGVISYITARKNLDPVFAHYLNSRSLTAKSLNPLVNMVLRVKKFISEKRGNPIKGDILPEFAELKWFQNLKSRATFRFYEGAEKYEPLSI